MTARSWWDDALCKGTPIEWWYPIDTTGGRVPPVTVPYCDACPVWAECRAYAIRHEHFGVWAGTSMRERDRIRTRNRIPLETPGVQLQPYREPTDDELAAIEDEAERTSA